MIAIAIFILGHFIVTSEAAMKKHKKTDGKSTFVRALLLAILIVIAGFIDLIIGM